MYYYDENVDQSNLGEVFDNLSDVEVSSNAETSVDLNELAQGGEQ